jgi:hypothetical protein
MSKGKNIHSKKEVKIQRDIQQGKKTKDRKTEEWKGMKGKTKKERKENKQLCIRRKDRGKVKEGGYM